MITNDVQYRTAKAQIERLEHLAHELADRPMVPNGGELIRKMETDAVEGQLNELREQLTEYDALKEGQASVGELSSLDELPHLLVRARIASGLSQRLLAERLGLKEQQIQRYESTAYAAASLSRLREVAAAVGLSALTIPSDEINGAALMRQLAALGLDPKFIRRRIAPATLREDGGRKRSAVAPVIDLAARVGRVFGVDATSLLSGSGVNIDQQALVAASFKLPKGVPKEQVAAYTVYAHYLALLTLQATEGLERGQIPSDPREFRNLLREPGTKVTLGSILNIVWSRGIPVLPLTDPGGFHAAVWKAHGREVIVLKQGARRSSRWVFDLLHEIGHIISGWEGSDGGIVDADDMSTDGKEIEANRFAGDVLLHGRAEDLVLECVEGARGSVERLKRVVPQVAASAAVDTGALANYVAFRLSLQGINWWGAATNLQSSDIDPWAICRDALIAHAHFAALNPLDRELMNQALVA